MRLRVIQLCLSGYHARATALAYVTSSGGRINSRRTQISTSGISTIVVQRSSSRSCLLQNKEIMPSYYARGNVLSLSCRGESSASLEATGQDPSELFDIYLPPPSLGVSCQPPEPAGFTKPRRLVHADGDWHRSVHVWLHNVKGEFVLQKRSTLKDTFPGLWDVSVGGHFTAGDTSLETACKEVREEVGLECDADSLRFVCTLSTSARGSVPLTGDFICNEYKDLYLMRFDGPLEDLKFSPSEVDDLKFVPMEELRDVYTAEDPAYISRPTYYVKALLAALKDTLGK